MQQPSEVRAAFQAPVGDARPAAGWLNRRRKVMLIAAGVLTVAALVAGVATFTADNHTPAAAAPTQTASDTATSPSASASSEAEPDDPGTLAMQILNRGTAALLKGDEAGWLAIVDPSKPKLRAYYRDLYTSLRGLGVTQLQYRRLIPKPVGWEDASWDEDFYLTYCFSMSSCPPFKYLNPGGPGAPMITQGLTIRKLAGRDYRITKVAKAKQASEGWQSTPWQVDRLVLAKGKRVTVAASRGNAGRLRQVLAAAEQAATRADHYAKLIGNPQSRYRVYLATDRQWRTWYGGPHGRWAIGYTTFPQGVLSEIVLRTSEAGRGRDLENLIQHEMAHAVTLGGLDLGAQSIVNPDMWLQEGIAEYIAYAPRPATATTRLPEVRQTLRSTRRPTSVALGELDNDASLRQSSVFYGLSHFAVDCIAQKYGETKLLDFIDLTLGQNMGYDKASEQVFGTPFRPVDRACIAWMQQQV
ncbi:hypothetical protein [Actinoplanes sp. NPDC049316]|uniref:hypothetical protein n=1 Tax=Actinoplanes sp. NPDC049316 TaxID=3154727 RepID=UPI00341E3A51